MRFSRLSVTAISLCFGATGCSSLLGLDDFTEGEDAASGTESASTTEGSGPGPGSGGGGDGPGASTNSTQSGPGGGGVGGDGGAPPGELVVTPDEPKVGILRPLQLEASIEVEWSVEEDGGGTIDASGRYISPFEPGTYHVIATSTADDAISVTVEINVVGLGVTLVGGLPGGPGNIDGTATKAHFDGPWGVGVDQDNSQRMFIADRENHTIRKFDDNTGLVTTLAGKAGEQGAVNGPGADARFSSPSDLVIDGSIWVADSENDCIRQINPATGVTTTLAGECGISGNVDGNNGATTRFDGISSMVLGPAGTALYVCQQGGSGSSMRRVNRTTGATTTIIANLSTPSCALASDDWRGIIYYAGYDGSDRAVRSFPDPYALIEDVPVAPLPDNARGLAAITGIGGEDHIYTVVSDYDDTTNTSFYRIFRLDVEEDTSFQELLGGEQGYVDGPYADVRLGDVGKLSVNRNYGWLMFPDNDGTVRRLSVFDEDVDTVVGPIPNHGPVDGGRTVARIPSPIGLALDGEGSVYETNFGENDNAVRKIDLATGQIETFSGVQGDFESGDGFVDGAANEARFGIAADVAYVGGNLYVTDFFASAVRRVDGVTGEVVTIAGQLNNPGDSDGTGAAALFNFAENDGIGGGITTDGVDLYVCDTSNFKIKKIDVSSGNVTTIAGGSEGSADGIGDQAQFASPAGITYSDGFLYVAEFLTNVVRKINLSNNEVTTIAGRAGEAGHADGGLGTSTFTTPLRLAADGIGNLYVSEFQGNTIRRITLDDNQTTTFMGTFGVRGFNAAPLPTSLNCPTALIVDPNGDLLFADACDGVVAIVRAL